MATSDTETMWIKGQDQFSSVCWRNMKTCVIRYTESTKKGQVFGTHPNTPSIEFYPDVGCAAKKEVWVKYNDDDTKDDYWHNIITGEVTWDDPTKAETKAPPPPPKKTPSSPKEKTSSQPGPPSPPKKDNKEKKKKNKEKKKEAKKEKADAPSGPPGPPGPPPGPPGPPGAPSSPVSSSTPSSLPSTPKYKKKEHQLWSRQIDKDYGKVWYNEKTGKQQVARPDCLKKYK